MKSVRQLRWVIGPLLICVGLALLLIAWYRPVLSGSENHETFRSPATSVAKTTSVATQIQAITQPFGGDLVSGVVSTPFAQPPNGSPPIRLDIDSVGIHEPIIEVKSHQTVVSGQAVREWDVADYAVGHHDRSADPGAGGNVVLAGHDDWHGEVFKNLHQIKKGADIVVTTKDGKAHHYRVTDILLPKIAGLPLSQQLAYGRLIEPTPDERLTLVTCWPYGIDDHRLIVIARPVG